jgi:hypothetical protein
MKEDHLPEDLSRWPTDPFALLGVAPGVSPKDLKKAYTRLLRRFRPEEFPEQFRRIRDAFELLQQQIKYSPWFLAPPPGEGTPKKQPSPEEIPPKEKAADFPLDDLAAENVDYPLELDGPGEPADVPWQPGFRPHPTAYQEEIVQLWDRAWAGEEDLAYRRLREIYHEHPQDKEILLRLYWLASVNPDLDHVRHPCDWLLEGLRTSGLAGPCRELYRRYVVNHPEEALGERFGRLLDMPAPANMLAQFVEWRWQAAGRLRQWGVIASDLELLGPRLLREDEETGTRLLLLAIDELAWFTEEPARLVWQSSIQCMDTLEHLHTKLGEAFSRLDFLLELANVWRTYARQSGSWHSVLQLIPLTWTRPPHELRPTLFQFLEELRLNLRGALELFDDIQERAPIFLAQLGRTLDGFQFGYGQGWDNHSAEEIEERTKDFLSGVDAADYRQFRWKLFNFCLRDFLAPEKMAEVMESRSTDPNVIDLFGRVRNDWALRVLCQGYRVFWG